MISITLGQLAGIISVSSYLPYTISIFRHKAHPNRASWIIWAVANSLIAISLIMSGENDSFWLPLGYGLGSSFIAILSIKYGEGGWTPFDKKCLAGAGLSIVLWWVFNTPLVALYMNIAIDFIAALPTFKKSYYEPEGEDLLTWAILLAGSLVYINAVESWTFQFAFYPISQVCIIGTVFILVLRPNIQRLCAVSKC